MLKSLIEGHHQTESAKPEIEISGTVFSEVKDRKHMEKPQENLD
jgi:hypothetical protein